MRKRFDIFSYETLLPNLIRREHFYISCLLNFYLILLTCANEQPTYCNFYISIILQFLMLPFVFPIIYILTIVDVVSNITRLLCDDPWRLECYRPQQKCMKIICLVPSLLINLILILIYTGFAVAFGPILALFGFFVYLYNMMYQLLCCKGSLQNKTETNPLVVRVDAYHE